ncbi:hypothetical protein LTSEMON_2215, partial [Salmonella enterica subsp. enterica serovar Montevideo str. S5-403]
LLMLTLSRGGPIVWISEADARELGIEDNDWRLCEHCLNTCRACANTA